MSKLKNSVIIFSNYQFFTSIGINKNKIHHLRTAEQINFHMFVIVPTKFLWTEKYEWLMEKLENVENTEGTSFYRI